MRVLFLTTAVAEHHQAVEYYELEEPGLGSRFFSEVSRSLKLIEQFPSAFHILGNRSRRCLVAKFPYGNIYQYKQPPDEILVIAVAHLHRKSEYWLTQKT